MVDIKRSSTRIRGFDDDEMDFQLIRQLGSASYGAASAGECLALAARTNDCDPSSWVEEFTKLAEWQEQDARVRASKGHAISARSQFFKASNSYRAAEYYTSCRKPTHRELGLKARECFSQAMRYVSHSFEAMMLPYKNIELPVYFMAPESGGRKRKTLIVLSGFDGTLEEEYFMRGCAALERGYNIVHLAGPGQMDLFRFHSDTCFEPDYEHPLATVIDQFSERPEIDMERLALMGISLGGYFVTRAASREPRIKALIVNSPVLDLHDYLAAFIGFDPADVPDAEDFTLEDLPQIPEDVMPRQFRSITENLIVRFGQASFKGTFLYLRQFVVGDAAANIRCPCLALVGSGEGSEPEKQFQEFCAKVSGPVAFHRFTEFEGGDTHCQVGNPSFSAAVAMDWLDEVFA